MFFFRNRETQNLLKQIEMMKAAVAREEEKAYELEIKSKLVNHETITILFPCAIN